MTLFTVDGLIRAQVRRDTGAWHPPTDVHRAHLRWAATQRDWGPDERRKDNGWLANEEWLYARRNLPRACLTGLGDEHLGTLDKPKNPEAGDSGALVRSAPFGLLVGWEPQLVCQLAVECAAQTHGAPAARLAAGALALTVHGLARGGPVEAAVAGALEQLAVRPGHEPVTEALGRALGAVREGVPDAGGWPPSGRTGTGPRAVGGGRLLRPGRRGRTARAAARREPRRPLVGDRRAHRRPARRPARRDGLPRPGWPTWRAAGRSWNWRTTSRWR